MSLGLSDEELFILDDLGLLEDLKGGDDDGEENDDDNEDEEENF